MSVPSTIATATWIRLNEVTNRTFVLPLVIFYPTSGCNSRCISCDWWKRSGADDLTLDEIDAVAGALPDLGTRLVVFSGGEPLLRPEVFQAASCFQRRGVTLHLLTSGVLLDRFVTEVAEHFARVTISLDATTEERYRAIRGIAAIGVVEKGVRRLRAVRPSLPITARATLHRHNFRVLPHLIDHAETMGLDGISFLSADVTSTAFGRNHPIDAEALTLSLEEAAEFAEIVEWTIVNRRHAFESGFVAESPDKLRRLPQYYAALEGSRSFPPVACNAPWISVVLEANGSVRPCFFHAPIGNIRDEPFASIVAAKLPAFRRNLDTSTNPICARCVCSLKAGWRNAPWA